MKNRLETGQERARLGSLPKKLADESEVKSTYSLILGGRFLKHVYSGSIQGKPRTGEELIVENKITKQIQVKRR